MTNTHYMYLTQRPEHLKPLGFPFAAITPLIMVVTFQKICMNFDLQCLLYPIQNI